MSSWLIILIILVAPLYIYIIVRMACKAVLDSLFDFSLHINKNKNKK